jgi:hypothetical protein
MWPSVLPTPVERLHDLDIGIPTATPSAGGTRTSVTNRLSLNRAIGTTSATTATAA